MKFVFISTMASDPWGGSEDLWSQTALRLRQKTHEVSASVAWWPELSPKVTALEKAGIDLFYRKPLSYDLSSRLRRKLKRQFSSNDEKQEFAWLRRQKPDLVFISQGGTQDGLEWMGFCAKEGLPFALIAHCNTEILWPDDDFGPGMLSAYRAAKKAFFVSQHNLKLLELQLAEKLPNATVAWNPCKYAHCEIPAWPKENQVWKLACVARLAPIAKAQELLFQLLDQKQWRDRPLEVNLYGGGKWEQGLKKLAGGYGLKSLHFRGHVADVRSIWEQNHMLILPSRSEGLPIALVEAMWCARPSLVTNVGGNAELCLDGETGFVAEAPTVGLLSQTLERAWDRRQEWQQMGKAARARVEQLIPKDPIEDFCQKLIQLAQNSHA